MNFTARAGHASCARAPVAKSPSAASAAANARLRVMAKKSTRGILIAHAKTRQAERGPRSLRGSLLEGRHPARRHRLCRERPRRGACWALARAHRDRPVRAGLSGRPEACARADEELPQLLRRARLRRDRADEAPVCGGACGRPADLLLDPRREGGEPAQGRARDAPPGRPGLSCAVRDPARVRAPARGRGDHEAPRERFLRHAARGAPDAARREERHRVRREHFGLRARLRGRRILARLPRDSRRGMLLRPQRPFAQGEPLRHASQVRRRAARRRGRCAAATAQDQGMTGRLEGRVAIVTGGGHGIGKAYALGLAKEGAKVVIAEIDAIAAENVAADLKRQGFEAIGVKTDVGDRASVEAMARRAIDAFGKIDILVNNAAIFATIPMSRSPFDEIGIDEWDRMMRVNLRGTWLASRAVVEHMRKNGYGKIINISSGTALKGSASRIHYVTSKAGVLGFTRTLAMELGKDGIRVNCIAPGSTLSEEDPDEKVVEMRTKAAEDRAIQRMQKPEDLVGAIVFFASADSDFVTGQTLVVDGGACMH